MHRATGIAAERQNECTWAPTLLVLVSALRTQPLFLDDTIYELGAEQLSAASALALA